MNREQSIEFIQAIEDTKKEKRQRRKQQVEYQPFEQDEYFYFIAGYTSGGAPYGITWEQAREDGLIDPSEERNNNDWDLPFD